MPDYETYVSSFKNHVRMPMNFDSDFQTYRTYPKYSDGLK